MPAAYVLMAELVLSNTVEHIQQHLGARDNTYTGPCKMCDLRVTDLHSEGHVWSGCVVQMCV